MEPDVIVRFIQSCRKPFAFERFALIVGLLALMCFAASMPKGVSAAEEEGVCARVRIRISQDVVLTRTIFRATLEVANSAENVPLEQFKVTLDIRDEDGQVANNLFLVKPPVLTNISDIDGAGTIDPGVTASAEWTITPTRDAAPEGPTVYTVGGTIEYMQGTDHITVPLFPAPITVKPDPLLVLDYFLVRNVYSDDPFTDEIEPCEPFPLGLLLSNRGKGEATNLRITSSQPEIIENEKGLLIEFKIIHTQVNDNPISPSLNVDFGDLGPDQTAVALWMMTCSLQGKFIEYKATFEHIDGLGDERVSLMDSVNIHELTHAVRVDVPSDDDKPDFLANDIPDETVNPNHLPNRLYNSDGTTAPVQPVTNGAVVGSPSPINLTAQLVAPPTSGWVYYRADDPGGDNYRLVRVMRSDGREVRIDDNAWATHRTIRLKGQAPYREHFVHIFDKDSTGSYTLFYVRSATPRMGASEAKKLANGDPVEINTPDGDGMIVTAILLDCIYVESPDRSSGIKVKGVSQSLLRGNRVQVIGKMNTEPSGERYVAAESVNVLSTDITEMNSLGMVGRAIGGGDMFGALPGTGQCGVTGGAGLNNIGLLVKTWGLVPNLGSDYLYVDDGSHLLDGTLTGLELNTGIRVMCDPTGIGKGAYLEVTGISSSFKTMGGDVAPLILARDSADIRTVEQTHHSIRGRVILLDYSGSVASQSVQVELRKQGGGSETRTVSLDNTGNYSLQNVSPGVYELAFKGLHWLRETTTVDVTSDLTGVDLSLVNGDVDGSNVVGPQDLTILTNQWGTAYPAADLDGSGTVGPDDLTILQRNWGKQGKP